MGHVRGLRDRFGRNIEIVHPRISLNSMELERLFERGYTGGVVIPNLGLHWSADAVNAPGGRQHTGQAHGGVMFHLLLPEGEEVAGAMD